MKILRIGARDITALVVTAVFIAALCVLNLYA